MSHDKQELRMKVDADTTVDDLAGKVKEFLTSNGVDENSPKLAQVLDEIKSVLDASKSPGPNQKAFSEAIQRVHGFLLIAEKVYVDCCLEKPEDREVAFHGAMHGMIDKLDELGQQIINSMPCQQGHDADADQERTVN